ncbi:hypothetical protein K491DRAFT_674886 [Lophiostoma macrostomum CBS 122681]|uniref:Uncharacterized protein n=1 Tax=Lophiostoma macrostomum CBS 122681 TaxID=1314788 RepID=A0A6A6TP61_9PLEO|nr:hypothetical protein K491DRAFT_674886 [Lophiostoma macrostomum CBS 122681]
MSTRRSRQFSRLPTWFGRARMMSFGRWAAASVESKSIAVLAFDHTEFQQHIDSSDHSDYHPLRPELALIQSEVRDWDTTGLLYQAIFTGEGRRVGGRSLNLAIFFSQAGKVDIQSVLQFAYRNKYLRRSRTPLYSYFKSRINELRVKRHIDIELAHRVLKKSEVLRSWISVADARTLAIELGVSTLQQVYGSGSRTFRRASLTTYLFDSRYVAFVAWHMYVIRECLRMFSPSLHHHIFFTPPPSLYHTFQQPSTHLLSAQHGSNKEVGIDESCKEVTRANEVQRSTKRGEPIFTWSHMWSWDFANPFAGLHLPRSIFYAPVSYLIQEVYRLIGKKGTDSHTSKPPDLPLTRPYTSIERGFQNQPPLRLSPYTHNDAATQHQIREISQALYGLTSENEWEDRDFAAWTAWSRTVEEKALAICARYIASGHPKVASAVPLKLSREMPPQFGRDHARKTAESDARHFGPICYLSASLVILLMTTDGDDILIPTHINIVGSHALGACHWKERSACLPVFPGQSNEAMTKFISARHAWNIINVYDLWDIFKDSEILSISDAFLLFPWDWRDGDAGSHLTVVDTKTVMKTFLPRVFSSEWDIRFLEPGNLRRGVWRAKAVREKDTSVSYNLGYERYTSIEAIIDRLLDIGFHVKFSRRRRPKVAFAYVYSEDFTATFRPPCKRQPPAEIDFLVNGKPWCHAYATCPFPATRTSSKYCQFHLTRLMQLWTNPTLTTSAISKFDDADFRLPDLATNKDRHNNTKSLLRTIHQAADVGYRLRSLHGYPSPT